MLLDPEAKSSSLELPSISWLAIHLLLLVFPVRLVTIHTGQRFDWWLASFLPCRWLMTHFLPDHWSCRERGKGEVRKRGGERERVMENVNVTRGRGEKGRWNYKVEDSSVKRGKDGREWKKISREDNRRGGGRGNRRIEDKSPNKIWQSIGTEGGAEWTGWGDEVETADEIENLKELKGKSIDLTQDRAHDQDPQWD